MIFAGKVDCSFSFYLLLKEVEILPDKYQTALRNWKWGGDETIRADVLEFVDALGGAPCLDLVQVWESQHMARNEPFDVHCSRTSP